MPFITKTPLQVPEPVAQPQSSMAQCLAGLGAHDVAVRRAAAQALSAFPDAVPALCEAIADETEQSVRSAILRTLTAIGTEEAVAALANCLRSEDAWLRNAAIELLREVPAQVAGVMAHLLVDWDRDVRILAVSVLDTLRHERVEEWLLQIIDADPDVNVCGAALDALAEVATEAAREPVRRVLARYQQEPYIGFAGKLILGRLATG